MVVFEQGVPKKAYYRRFNIQTVSGPDDFASMEEVLTAASAVIWPRRNKPSNRGANPIRPLRYCPIC